MINLNIDELPANTTLISGSHKTDSMMEGLTPEFNGAVFIGYHGPAGKAAAVLSHTYTDSIARITLNDMIAGEATLNGALAGSRNVPVLLVSGDNTVAEEITGWQTGTVPVITKFGISRSAGKMLHPEQVDQNYSNAVSQVFKTQIKPFNPTPPYRLEIFFRETQMTDIVVRIPGTRRSGDNSVIFEAADYQTLFRAFLAIQTISSHNYLK